MKLRVAGFLDNTMVNGQGLRSALFVSGCNHNCVGCHNKEMQNFNYGEDIDINEVFNRIKSNVPLIKGVTFSGGEPFEQPKSLVFLAKMIKRENLNIWCYTGYTFEQILESKDKDKLELLKQIDVLIDGKFKENLTDRALKYTGSSNQRIIDAKGSFQKKKAISIKNIT